MLNTHFIPDWIKQSIIREVGIPLDESDTIQRIDMKTLNRVLESVYSEGYEKGYWQGQLTTCDRCEEDD